MLFNLNRRKYPGVLLEMQIWGPTHRGSDPVSPGEGTNARVPASSRGACCCSEHHTWSGQIKGQGRGSPLGGPHSAVQGRAGPCPSLSPAISHRVEGMKPAVRITAASLPVVTFSCDFRRPAVPVRRMRGTRRDVSVARGPGERET